MEEFKGTILERLMETIRIGTFKVPYVQAINPGERLLGEMMPLEKACYTLRERAKVESKRLMEECDRLVADSLMKKEPPPDAEFLEQYNFKYYAAKEEARVFGNLLGKLFEDRFPGVYDFGMRAEYQIVELASEKVSASRALWNRVKKFIEITKYAMRLARSQR